MSSPSASKQTLHVIYGSQDLTWSSEGLGTNKPIVRKRAILDALKRASTDATNAATNTITFQPIDKPAASLSQASLVHDEKLVDLFATGFARWEALGPNRDLYFSTGGRVNPKEWEELIPSQVAPRDAFQRPGNSLHGAVCFYAQDQMTPINRHTSEILHTDHAVLLESVKLVLEKQQPQVYACTTEPGHHSSRQSYGGYCFVNNAALATEMLKKPLGKVALLDVDYHAGNGSYSIFASDPDVFFTSIHADPEIEYPYCHGFADQNGEGAGKGTKLNVPLGKGTTWKDYKPHLESVLDQMKKFGAKALVVSLGVDTINADPEAAPLAGFALHQADYTEMGNMIRGLGVPIIWVQEGGYKLDEAGEVVRHVLVGNTSIDKQ